MVCVSHVIGFARYAAVLFIFMDHGQIVVDSTPHTLFFIPAQVRT
jgi:ABC-type polar amino acid transport system ATPase subunit